MEKSKNRLSVFFGVLGLVFVGFSMTSSTDALACGHGQVSCGGECHSSAAMCPGHDHHGAQPGSGHGCGSGQVFCGGACHSSPSMCPGANDGHHHGNNDNDNDDHHGGWGGGSWNTGPSSCGWGTHWDGWQCVSNSGGWFGGAPQPVCPAGYYWNGVQCVW